MNRTRARENGGAIARATRIWGNCAIEARGALRRQGVRGDTRTLDVIASGQRGHAVPQGLAAFALELRAKGVPVAEIERRIVYAAEQMVRAVCVDGPLAA